MNFSTACVNKIRSPKASFTIQILSLFLWQLSCRHKPQTRGQQGHARTVRSGRYAGKMAALGEDKIRDHIKTIGLFNSKAKNVYKLSQILAEEHGGKVPKDRDTLVKLPGVGRKTANVVLNIAFGQPTLAVDTHIHRIANRTGMVKTNTPEKTELALLKIIPGEFMRHAHHWLILHGRYVCTARKPKCPDCIVRDLCAYKDKTQAP